MELFAIALIAIGLISTAAGLGGAYRSARPQHRPRDFSTIDGGLGPELTPGQVVAAAERDSKMTEIAAPSADWRFAIRMGLGLATFGLLVSVALRL